MLDVWMKWLWGMLQHNSICLAVWADCMGTSSLVLQSQLSACARFLTWHRDFLDIWAAKYVMKCRGTVESADGTDSWSGISTVG